MNAKWLSFHFKRVKQNYYFNGAFPFKETGANYNEMYIKKLICPEIIDKITSRRRLLSIDNPADSSADKEAMEKLYKKSVLTVEHKIPEQKVDEALQIKEHGVFVYLFKLIDDFLYKHLGWWWYLLPSTGILLIIAGIIVCCCCCCKR